MRKTLSRVAALATSAVLATVLMPAGTASAATSNDCRATESDKILTGGLFGNTTDRLWIDHPTATRTMVCFQFQSLSFGGLTIIADVANGATLPNVDVNPYGSPSACPNVIATLSNPVAFRLAVNLATNSVCLTVDTQTLVIQFSPGNIGPSNLPVLEIWRDGGPAWGWFDVAACPAEWAVAVAFGGPTTCMSTNARIFP